MDRGDLYLLELGPVTGCDLVAKLGLWASNKHIRADWRDSVGNKPRGKDGLLRQETEWREG